MRIVAQSAQISHTLFPPYLMLPAPRIAGLLPAHVPSSEPLPFEPIPEPPKQAPPPYVFDRPALADLSAPQREKLYEAVDTLLEIAVEFMLGTFNEDALRAAEVLFHRAAGGKSAIRPLGPKAFSAEIDADWLESARKLYRPIKVAEAESIVRRARTYFMEMENNL